MRARRTRALAVTCATLALAGWQMSTPASASTSASTSHTARAPSRPLAYVPLRGAKNTSTPNPALHNMDYNGGPVMPSNTDYMVLWSPSGEDAYPSGFVSGIQQFFQDLQADNGKHTNVDSVSSQYQDLTGAFSQYDTIFGGVLVDQDPYPTSQCPTGPTNAYVGSDETATGVTNCLTDAQIQSELTSYVTGLGLPTDLSHEYFQFTPPGVESCFNNDANQTFGGCSAGEPLQYAFFCAYHENTSLSPMLLYANMPFDAQNQLCTSGNYPNNSISDGEIDGGLSHEQNESQTDPIPNDAWTDGNGGQQGQEVGDECDGNYGTPLGTAEDGSLYNQVINGHEYYFQQEWSNQTSQCLQRLTPTSNPPHAHMTVTAGSGLTLNFSAYGSSAPSHIAAYVWQFNAVNSAQTIETTTPTVSYTFPSAGAYSVGLTIFEGDGTSAGTGGIVTTGQNGTTPGFTVAGGHSHSPVSFIALSSVSAQSVISYLWEFGDGTTGYGRITTHHYSWPGQYVVTLVMFSGVGSAFPGAGAAPISQRVINVTVT